MYQFDTYTDSSTWVASERVTENCMKKSPASFTQQTSWSNITVYCYKICTANN